MWDTVSSSEEGWRAERRGGADKGFKGLALIMTAPTSFFAACKAGQLLFFCLTVHQMRIKLCRPEGRLYKNLCIHRFSPTLWKGQRVDGLWGNRHR